MTSTLAPMTRFDRHAFEQQALAQGFDAVVVRDWAPGTVVPPHTHPFDAHALVLAGEMWLTVVAETRHLRPGDGFDVAAGVEHAERYGPHGATYWVAWRS